MSPLPWTLPLPEAAPPSTLYHYTDAQGLIGILGSLSWSVNGFVDPTETFKVAAKLLASDVRYKNDREELMFGARVLWQRLHDAFGNGQVHGELRKALPRLAVELDPDRLWQWRWRCFAACFCEEGDLLSQWRGYAGGVGGFAIGFNSEALMANSYSFVFDPLMQQDVPARTKLRQVVYGVDSANEAADAAVNALIDRVQPMTSSCGKATASTCRSLPRCCFQKSRP